jgi:hypothetical protein
LVCAHAECDAQQLEIGARVDLGSMVSNSESR